MRLLLFLCGMLALCFVTGCLRPGYHHTHPCTGPDGVVRTVRHWHANRGYAGYHTHPFPNHIHRTLMMSADLRETGEEEPEE
jgi:hypothetical protein